MSRITRRVVVVGSGIAGTAAALTIRSRAPQLDVTMVLGAAGATVLAGGAFDGPGDLGADSLAVLTELGYCRAPEADSPGFLVATTAGILRPARAIDDAMLDLESMRDALVLLPRANHGGWDADALAKAFSVAPEARSRGLRFEAVTARLVQRVDELSMSDAEVARRNSSPERVAWLGAQLSALRAEFAEARAILLPSWMPLHREAQATLREAVGLPIGEALGLPPGPSGLRFLRARDASFATCGIHVIPGFVSSIERDNDLLALSLADGSSLTATVVVLATGGLIAGGLQYSPAESIAAGELPVRSELPFRLTYGAPVTLGAHGRPLLIPGSLFGDAPEALAWPFVRDASFERVGILTESGLAAPGVFACGDAEADGARLWLGALERGTQAGLATLLVV